MSQDIGKIICSWCDTVMLFKFEGGLVSHGLCDTCLEKHFGKEKEDEETDKESPDTDSKMDHRESGQ